MPIGVSVLAKHERETVFQLWQINICSKLCLLSKTEIVNGGLDKGTFVSSFCWSPEGTLMVADTMGSLYLVGWVGRQCWRKLDEWASESVVFGFYWYIEWISKQTKFNQFIFICFYETHRSIAYPYKITDHNFTKTILNIYWYIWLAHNC